MTLSEFLTASETDRNTWYKLSPGEMQNLFEEAVEEIERLTKALLEIVARATLAHARYGESGDILDYAQATLK